MFVAITIVMLELHSATAKCKAKRALIE